MLSKVTGSKYSLAQAARILSGLPLTGEVASTSCTSSWSPTASQSAKHFVASSDSPSCGVPASPLSTASTSSNSFQLHWRASPQNQLTITRGYAHMVKYSHRVGRAAPRSWPQFEALKAPKDGGEMRWFRSVLRFPPEVTAEMPSASVPQSGMAPKQSLKLKGKAGRLVVNLEKLDPTGLVAFRFLQMSAANGTATASSVDTAASATPAASPNAAPSAAATSSAPSPVSKASDKKPAGPAAADGVGGTSVGQQGALLLLASHNKALVESVSAQVESHIRGVTQGFLVGLTAKGVGYRLEPMEAPVAKRSWYFEVAPPAAAATPGGGGAAGTSGAADKQPATPIVYPFPRPVHAIRLKVGYSRPVVFPLPAHIRAFFVKPTLMYLYGLRLAELEKVAGEIRAVRKPNAYTGNGVQLVNEVVKLKQRKSAK